MVECPHSIYFFRGDATNNFDLDSAANTLKDWFLVPLSRPVIAPPKQKLQTINIPGANGVLDLSNSLTHYPVFENRTGNIKFAVLNDKPGHDWLTVYTKIMKFLQGNNVKMILEDDPKYFYEGRVYVDEWDSKNDGTWSEITLGYDLQPYRRSIKSSVGDWLWDPFNFETDMVTDTTFSLIEVDSDDWVEYDFTGLIDMMPVMPEITVTSNDNNPIYAQVYNTDLHLNWRDVNAGAGMSDGTRTYYDCILCEVTPESIIKMRFKGHGSVTLDFRSGRL